MDSPVKQFSIAFFLLAASAFPVRARESHFFSKMVRNETATESPAIVKEDPVDPASMQPGSQNGYGLYGHGPNEFPSATANANYDNYYNRGQAQSRYMNNGFSAGGYLNKEEYGMSDTRLMQNGKYFYDLNAERYRNGYNPVSENYSGYASEEAGNGAAGSGFRGYGGYSSTTDGNVYEYNDNAVEGNQYKYRQEENQEDYAP